MSHGRETERAEARDGDALTEPPEGTLPTGPARSVRLPATRKVPCRRTEITILSVGDDGSTNELALHGFEPGRSRRAEFGQLLAPRSAWTTVARGPI